MCITEIAAASDPAAVKKAEERRQAKREERERFHIFTLFNCLLLLKIETIFRLMKEEKERQELEKKRQEDEEKAQIELVKKQRAEVFKIKIIYRIK